ncbi:MAG: hypothetical protein LBJ62_08560 [Bifidobacteriaceae bacterium]|jgi:hypothetical protein|nr:hypothetical protein [Bifidobacteriaceae bacterium]
MKLKNGLRVYWRSRDEAQIGSDPRLTVTIALEHPREFEILQLLEKDQTVASLRRKMQNLGGQRERVDELLRPLAEASLLQPGSRNRSPELEVNPDARDMLAAEADSRALMESNSWRQMVNRGRQCVSIYGLGRTGAHIAMGLANAGVGLLQLNDPSPVAPRDRGQVYSRHHIGLTRSEALARIIQDQGLQCRIRTAGRWQQPQAAVLVDYEVSDPNRSAFLSSHGVAHLSVTIGELSISCGPWVPSSAGPCLRCLRLWAVEADPYWPGVATQQFVRSSVAARGEDSTMASVIGGLGVSEILSGLAGRRPFTAGRSITMSLPSYAIEWHDVDPHPQCKAHHPKTLNRSDPAPPPVLPLPPAP